MKAKKILFIKLSSLGDIIQTVPSALFAKTLHPGCVLTWAVESEYAALLDALGVADEIISLPFRAFRKKEAMVTDLFTAYRKIRASLFDVSLDFQGNTKSGVVHMAARSHVKIGRAPQEWLNRVSHDRSYPLEGEYMAMQYVSLVAQAFHQTIPSTYPTFQCTRVRTEPLLVAPCSLWNGKMVPFSQLEQLLEGREYDLICGSEKEAKQLEGFFMKARTRHVRPSYKEWMTLTQSAKGVVAMDSAQLHLAALFGVPTFSFFGPTQPALFAPQNQQDHFVFGACPERRTFPLKCPVLKSCSHHGCIKRQEFDPASFTKWYMQL